MMCNFFFPIVFIHQYALGYVYATGADVPEVYVQAYMWYNLAAPAEDTSAKGWRDETAKKMTKEQIVEAQRLSTAFKPTKTP